MARQLGSLDVGALIKDTTTTIYGKPILWKIADKNHSGYPENSVTLITNYIIKAGALDGKENLNIFPDRQIKGNNRYIYSNMRQWLNSNAEVGAWYSPQHSEDKPPNSTTVGNNPYEAHAGFLNSFSVNMINNMLVTTLTVAKDVLDGGGTDTFTDKVFLASVPEMGLYYEGVITDGIKLALFFDDASRLATPTGEAVSNALSYRGFSVGTPFYWGLRSAGIKRMTANGGYATRAVSVDGTLLNVEANHGIYGIRPLCNLSSTILVSDNVDTDGAYTIIWNDPPNPPETIVLPDEIWSNKNVNITWSAGSDPNNDSISYHLERSVNSGSWAEIYSGGLLSLIDNITTSMNTVQYRIRSVDQYGAFSGYTTSAIKNVLHNKPPIISGSDGDLGIQLDAFSHSYTVTNPDNDPITVTEKLNGTVIRTYTIQENKQTGIDIKGVNWLKLEQGSHELSITAQELEHTVNRQYTFTKKVDGLWVAFANPLEADTRPQRILINIVAQVASMATVKVEVCNNAFDTNPNWEDASEAVSLGKVYKFTNKVKQEARWGVNIRVSITRNGSLGDCYISKIEGDFL